MTGSTRSERGKLGGLKRLQVMRELAAGGQSQEAIAAKHGVTQGAVSQFAKKYAVEIQEIRENMADEFAGLWITKKHNRLAMYEEIAAQALKPTPKVTPAGKLITVINPETHEPEVVMEIDGRAALAAGKQAAEELGQLATRVQLGGELATTTTYKIEGVQPEDLT
jgi:hypothetical protein